MKNHFLGIDLGSSYTKFCVTDDNGKLNHLSVIKTLSRHKDEFHQTIEKFCENYNISKICATGYGRNSIKSDLTKTELICASIGISAIFPTHKCIVDIGGEDIKVIECGSNSEVIKFHMNDKCSAGTGSFITEIAERAELDITEMSDLAKTSTSNKPINSFRTLFAKSEILNWKFKGTPIEDIAKGIYLSIVNRIRKLPLNNSVPVYLCGGVIAYHHYLEKLISEELNLSVKITPDPQYMVAYGAALVAGKSFKN